MQKLAFIRRRRSGVCVNDESGQTMIFVVVGLAVVLLAIVGFAVDYGNIWFHRQRAQSAADAACTAAVMDMLNNVSGATSTGGVTTGVDIDCATPTSPIPSPCAYANLNGYNGSGLVAGSESNSVQVTFPTSLAGDPIPVCPDPIPSSIKVCIPANALTSNPFVQVQVTSRLKATFFGLLSAANTVDVPAKSSCGIVLASSPVPLLVLDPTRENTLTGNGNITIRIIGGPTKSIQVDSASTSATNGPPVSISGASGAIDLSAAGPNGKGADFGVTGSNAKPGILALGTEGNYVSPSQRIQDPYSQLPSPQRPNFTPTNGSNTTGLKKDGTDNPTVGSGVLGCPDTSCHHYSPGNYPNGIQVKNFSAIFDPGIYYVENGMTADPNSCMRPSTATGDGSGGTIFYFADAQSLKVDSNSGSKCPTAFQTTTGTGSLLNGVKCTSTSSTPALAATISGNVLLAPCSGPDPTTGMCAPNCDINAIKDSSGLVTARIGYGDPLGSGVHPGGIQRGMLFFQNRSVKIDSKDQPSWSGGGSFLTSGTMYFHHCVLSAPDKGTGCDNNAFDDQLTLGGGSGSGTYVMGEVVVDHLNLSGNPDLTMVLNPNPSHFIFKASLLQ